MTEPNRKRSRSRSPSRSLVPVSMPDPDSMQVQDFLQAFQQSNAAKSTKIDSQVYVDYLQKETNTQQFIQLFIEAMRGAGLLIRPGNPITRYWRPPNGQFVFLQFRAVQQANNSLILTGNSYKGKEIKVSRPKNYTGSQPLSTANMNSIFGNYPYRNASKTDLQQFASKARKEPRKLDPPSNILKIIGIISRAD